MKNLPTRRIRIIVLLLLVLIWLVYGYFSSNSTIDTTKTTWYKNIVPADKTQAIIPYTLSEQFVMSGERIFENDFLPSFHISWDTQDAIEHPRSLCFTDSDQWDHQQECTIPIDSSTTYVLVREQSDNSNAISYTLRKNGSVIWSKNLVFGAYEPVLTVFRLNNSVILTYVSWWSWNTTNDVVINGESMNEKIQLSNTHTPMIIHDKLVFLWQKDMTTSLIIDGKKYSLPYEEIFYNGCCAMAWANPIATRDSLYFYAKKDHNWYRVTLDIH